MSRRRAFVGLASLSVACAASAQEVATSTWGESQNGLQARVVTVAPDTRENGELDFEAVKHASSFDRPEDITLLVELKNVGERPVELLGVRYGDRIQQSHRGRSNSAHFAPHLFQCEFIDSTGQSVKGPDNEMDPGDAAMVMDGAKIETLTPGESLVALLRPGQWDPSVARLLNGGEHRLRIHYRGLADEVVQRDLTRVKPRLSADLWSGDVVAADVAVNLKRAPLAAWREPVWGEPLDGLRSAVELRSGADTGHGLVETASSAFSYGSRVEVRFLIENVSDHEISFWSEDHRYGDPRTLFNADGSVKEERQGGATPFTGWAVIRRWTLRPDQVAVLRAMDMLVLWTEPNPEPVTNPAWYFFAAPGQYGLQYDIRFNGWRRGAGRTEQAIPGPNDWQKSLRTGVAPIEIRDPRAG